MKGTIQSLAMLSFAVLLVACGTTRSVVVQRAGAPRSAAYPASSRPQPPGHAASYRVVKGDTLYSIAFRHGVDFRDVARWNGIPAPYTIWPGQQLVLRAPSSRDGGAARPVARVSPPPRVPPARAAVARPAAPSIAASAPRRPATMADEVPVAGEPAGVPMPPAAPPAPSPGGTRSVDGVQWRWPADGRMISGFRSGDAIPGIEIGGAAGSPVRAAADGVVVYSGNGLVGYGELIIVKHNDAFLSAYGHNRKRLVREGQRVSAGQQIAEMGDTGASRNELQFQIRRNGNPVNPLDYLPAR
ncbi:peptidoglycan DD-metalloendopeptidase family protein [Dyella sp. KRB-257]|uniref:peptidoglycan DD-metalloendopeptidase family protein n=1 Tax=Dyella sp. KRB-257 TaxID=3400915 RepID=UPI003C10E388